MKTFFKQVLAEFDYTSKKLGLMILFFVGMPVLVMWFTGVYDREYVDDVPIAVLDQDNSSLSRELVQYFNQDERFRVTYEVTTQAELQKLIDKGKVYMGVYIPPHLNEDIKSGKQTKVLILTDGTNMIISNNVYAGAASIIQTVSAGASIQVIEGKDAVIEDTAEHIALSFKFEERMLYDSKMTYMNYLIYGIIAVIFQQLMLSGMATLLARNPEEVARGNTAMQIGAKMTVSALLLIVTGSLAIFLVHTRFPLIYRGHVGIALLLTILFAIAISAPGIWLFSITKKKTRFTQIAYMLSLPTFLTCGYVWPADQMPAFLHYGAKILWPLMNYARAFDEVMIKGLPLSAVASNILELIIYSIIFLPLAVWCFKKQFNHRETLQKRKEVHPHNEEKNTITV